MAYFSNGTEGMTYRERYCEKCIHLPDREDRDCPIWSAHFFHNYDRHKNEGVALILDMLIPRSADGLSNERCSFFQTRPAHLLAGKGLAP